MKRLLYIVLLLLPMVATSCMKAKQHVSVEDASTDTTIVSKPNNALVIHLMDRPAPVDTLRAYNTEMQLQDFLLSEYDIDKIWAAERRIVCHSPLPERIKWSDHPLIDGVRYAYANHHPMVINPDVMWLTIEQGFALHVKYYAEELRYLFVDHEGQRELCILCKPDLIYMPYSEWEPYFPQFTDSIAAWTKDSIAETLVADFSTTDATALVASQIGLMSAMQHYFAYVMEEACGIPDIYLEGTADDWRHLISKANRLRRYGLDWWIDKVEPVLTKIAESAEGNPDLDFWRSMYRTVPLDTLTVEEIAELWNLDLSQMTEEEIADLVDEYYFVGCGPDPASENINGWITLFYPYKSYGKTPEDARINHDAFDDATLNQLPLSRTLAPLKYKDLSGCEMSLMLHAGLFTFTEDSVTRAIRPTIGWMVTRTLSDQEIKKAEYAKLEKTQLDYEEMKGTVFHINDEAQAIPYSNSVAYWHGNSWVLKVGGDRRNYEAICAGSGKALFDSIYFDLGRLRGTAYVPQGRHYSDVSYSYTFEFPISLVELTYTISDSTTTLKVYDK